MAKKKRKIPKRTPEDQAEFDRRTEMIRERIAYREARERELEEATRAKQD